MKKKLYVIITLCALHIASAHALTIFGYDVTSWATKAFSVVRSYFTRARPIAQPTSNNQIRRLATIQQQLANTPQKPSAISVEPTEGLMATAIAKVKDLMFRESLASISLTNIIKEAKHIEKLKKLLEDPKNYASITKEALKLSLDVIQSPNRNLLLSNNSIAVELIAAKPEDIRFLIVMGYLNTDSILSTVVTPYLFEKLAGSENGIKLLYRLFEKEKPQPFTFLALNNFGLLASNTHGIYLLKKIFEAHPDQTFIAHAVQNFQKILSSGDGVYLLNRIFTKYPTQDFVRPVLDNFALLIQNRYGLDLLTQIFNAYPNKKFIQPILDHYNTISTKATSLLQNLIRTYPEATPLFIEKMGTNIFYPFNNLAKRPITQTKQHLITHLNKKYKLLKRGGDIDYECCPELQKMTKEVIRLEAQEQAKGRYTFVHAHEWRYHFLHEIYTDQWSIMHNKPLNAYRFIRFEQIPEVPWMAWEQFLYTKEHEKSRVKLVNAGLPKHYHFISNKEFAAQCKFHLLFMNYALFAGSLRANSAYYLKKNNSAYPIKLNPQDFLKELKVVDYFNEAELKSVLKQLQILQEEHAKLSKYGGGLLLSFTPEALKKSVFASKPGGIKRTVIIISKDGVKTETSDAQVILNALRNEPHTIQDSDDIEFACILSHDCTLIPNNGLDIYEFNAADQDKLAAWRAKKDELMQQIKTIVDEKRAKQQAQQIKPRL